MSHSGSITTEDPAIPFPIQRHTRSGRLVETVRDVQRETTLSVYLDGRPTVTLGCSASHVGELTLGRLFSEGLISSMDEISRLSLGDEGTRADVMLASRQKPPFSLQPVAPIPWKAADVFAMMDAFDRDQSAHNRTRGAHSAYLWRNGQLLCRREDIGRRNAFDKIVGFALAKGVNLAECAIFTSGTVPTDMVEKTVRGRLPLLVSKAAVTDKTIELARIYHLTLIGNAREGAFEAYNDPRRATPLGQEGA